MSEKLNKEPRTEQAASSAVETIVMYNLIWDEEPDSFRSSIVGYPVYEMKCNKCLHFIGAFSKPEKCEDNFCSNCGNPIKVSCT